MVQRSSLGYDMKKDVVADDFHTWATLWGEAIRLQERHSWIRGIAETKTTDPEAAIREIIPILAFLNPSICAAVKGSCELAVEVLRECTCGAPGDPVSPPRDTPRNIGVEGGRMRDMGGQQPQDRLAELEAENAELRALLEETQDDLVSKNQRLQAIAVIVGHQPARRRTWRTSPACLRACGTHDEYKSFNMRFWSSVNDASPSTNAENDGRADTNSSPSAAKPPSCNHKRAGSSNTWASFTSVSRRGWVPRSPFTIVNVTHAPDRPERRASSRPDHPRSPINLRTRDTHAGVSPSLGVSLIGINAAPYILCAAPSCAVVLSSGG